MSSLCTKSGFFEPKYCTYRHQKTILSPSLYQHSVSIKFENMKFILIFSISLCFQATAFAQTDSKEWQEEMQKEMQEQLQNFGLYFDQFNFKMDTLLMKDFQFPGSFDTKSFVMPNDIDMGEMMKMLERSFSQKNMEGMMKRMEDNLNQMDMSELQKLFEPFMDGNAFIIPSPEQFKKGKKNKNTSPKKKKKKSYSL